MRDGARHRNRLGDLADPALIEKLAGWLEASGASELEIQSNDGQSLIISMAGSAPIGGRNTETLSVKAPLAGHFLMHADLGRGSSVNVGDILGLIEIGPLHLPVTASAKGIVRKIHGESGQLYGYGAPLFTLEPKA